MGMVRDMIGRRVLDVVEEADRLALAGEERLAYVMFRSRPTWFPSPWYRRVWREEVRYYARGLPRRSRRKAGDPARGLPGQLLMFDDLAKESPA
jgi:hypothetical protein